MCSIVAMRSISKILDPGRMTPDSRSYDRIGCSLLECNESRLGVAPSRCCIIDLLSGLPGNRIRVRWDVVHDDITPCGKFTALQWFGHKVACHLISRTVFDDYIASKDLISDKEVSDVESSGALTGTGLAIGLQ